MEAIQPFIPLITSALGGTFLGPIISRLVGGKAGLGLLGGIAGGVGAHFGADAAGIGSLLGSGEMMGHIQSVLQGGVGGGALAILTGLMSKK